ncbi:MAG: hypothetical protein J1D89_09025, partial [Agathobacter sp.]|nr:hypothetical protein [Agathobacter sp.]
ILPIKYSDREVKYSIICGRDRESAGYTGESVYIETNYWENADHNVNKKNMGKGIAAYQNYMPEGGSAFGVQKEKYEKLAGVSAAGTVNMADATYPNPMKPEKDETVAQEIQSKTEQSAKSRANEIAVLANTTSPEDLKQMEENGFSVMDSDSRTIITVTDKIKAVLAKAGVDISAYGDTLTREQLEQITDNPTVINQIVQVLESNDLPATDANVQESAAALEQAASLSGVSENTMSYLLKNSLEPTIHNVYKAEHAGVVSPEDMVSAVSPEALQELEPQIAAIVEDAGLTVSEDTIDDGKWLVAQQIPLTKDNLTYFGQLKELDTQLSDGTYNWNELVDSMAKAILSGKRPEDGYMITARRRLEETRLMMTTEARAAMQRTGIEIDTKPLEALVEGLKEQERQYYRALLVGEGIEPSEKNVDILVRTEEVFEDLQTAPAYAIGQVTDRDTVETIHDSGEALRREFAQANEPYEPLRREFASGRAASVQMNEGAAVSSMQMNESAAASSVQTNRSGEPLSAVQTNEGATVSSVQMSEGTAVPSMQTNEGGEALSAQMNEGEESAQTLRADENPEAVRREFVQANERYETMQTAPRADMGDSIQKAFRNVDNILTDMNLEISEPNRRAVRILSYNEMPLTEENIQAVKARDEEMQRAFKNMNPAVTLEMIRRGQNPLDMTLEELNSATEQIKAETGHEEQERFSKYLWKLEQNQEISQEERDSYIGIYRLIAQVERTDGAALGFLMNQGSEPTMRNLLTAMRSARKGQMDYTVDDDFEGVKSTAKGPRIDEQIEAAFQQNCLKDVLDSVTPEKLARLGTDNWENMTPEQLAEALREMESAEQEDQAQEAYVKAQMAEYQQVLQTSEEVYAYLERYHMPNSAMNIMAVSEMMRHPNQVMNRLWKQDSLSKSSADTIAELKAEVLKKFGESLKNPEELADAQEKLADVAEHVMDTMLIDDPSVRSLDVRELRRSICAFELCAKKAQEECYMVPIQTGDSVTGVSLKIVRGKEEKGLVDIIFDSPELGRVAASFYAHAQGISGMIAVSGEDSYRKISENLDALINEMKDGGYDAEAINIKTAYVSDLSLENYEMAGIRREERMSAAGELAGDKSNTVQTARLYHIAETFIRYSKEL